MHFNSNQDGIGLDLTPFVTAANTAADVYSKTKAADAQLAAAKANRPPAVQVAAAAARKPNWIAYGILGAVGIGGFFLVRRMLGRRGRR